MEDERPPVFSVEVFGVCYRKVNLLYRCTNCYTVVIENGKRCCDGMYKAVAISFNPFPLKALEEFVRDGEIMLGGPPIVGGPLPAVEVRAGVCRV